MSILCGPILLEDTVLLPLADEKKCLLLSANLLNIIKLSDKLGNLYHYTI